jgi:hypothetical protein
MPKGEPSVSTSLSENRDANARTPLTRPMPFACPDIPCMLDPMDGSILVRRLERAERRRVERARLIASQNELIAKMSTLGLDATPYRNMLARFEKAGDLFVEDMSTAKRDADSAAQN